MQWLLSVSYAIFLSTRLFLLARTCARPPTFYGTRRPPSARRSSLSPIENTRHSRYDTGDTREKFADSRRDNAISGTGEDAIGASIEERSFRRFGGRRVGEKKGNR